MVARPGARSYPLRVQVISEGGRFLHLCHVDEIANALAKGW